MTQFLLIISKQSMCSTHDVVQVQSATGCFPCSLLEPPSYYMLVPRQTTIDKSHRSSSDALDRIGRGFDGGLNWNNKIQWKVKLRGKSRQVIYTYARLLTTCNGHGQSGWSPIGCEGLYIHTMCENRVSVSGWPPIGCAGSRTKWDIPSPLPPTLVFR